MSENHLDRRLSADETALVATTRAFCSGAFSDELFAAYREGRPFGKDWIRAWASTGMLGLQAKREHGGLGASYLCKIRVAQEMAAHGFAAAFCLNHHQGCVTRLSQTGTPEQIERLLRPALVGESLISIAMSEAAGSDVPAMTTMAVPVDNGWRLRGAKAWVTNGLLVDTLILLAKVEGAKGDPIASFFVPLGEAGTVSRRELTMPGARSFRLAEVSLEDHFVPHWAMVAPPGKALKAAMAGINGARVHVAAMSVAALRSALAWTVDYGTRRHSFGSPLVEHQGWRWALAEVSAGLEAAEALVSVAADAIDRGENPVVLAAQCKAFAVETAIAGLDRLMRGAGAVGASDACRLPMQHSETRLAAYADGTREMLLDRIGRSLGRTYSHSPLAEGGIPVRNVVVGSPQEAIAGLKDGDTVMMGGFGGAGVPTGIVRAARDAGLKDLVVISNNAGASTEDLTLWFEARMVRKIVCSYPRGAKAFTAQYRAGDVELELVPQGTLVERIRAGGAGLGGFLSPVGVGTSFAEGKQIIEVGGRPFLLEEPLRADFAFVKGRRADTFGNTTYNKAARNHCAVMATAGRMVAIEVDEIVEPGDLDPESIVTPCIFVDRVYRKAQ